MSRASSTPPPTPGLSLRGRVRLGVADPVLAAGPDGVGAHGTAANALYAAEQVLRELPPRLVSSVVLDVASGRLVCSLHPAGGPVELWVAPDGTAGLEARTGLAGPGYHRFLAEVAGRMGAAMGAAWEVAVPTRARAEEAALAWLRHHAEAALAEVLAAGPGEGLGWLPPLLPGTGWWQGAGAVATTTGPRGLAWLQAVARDPRAGIDALPWWEDGLGVATKVGRARCVIWREVRWRLPSTDPEVATLAEVANLLAEAWEEDPALADAPWAAWHEVLGLLHEAEERRRRVAARAGTTRAGGYRRHRVRELLPGGWAVTLPGDMGVSWSEEEGWVAWTAGEGVGPRTAWASALRLEEGVPPRPDGAVLERWERPDGAGVVVEVPPDPDDEEDDGPTCVLSAHLRAGDRLLVLTLAWQDGAAGRTWARAVWDSLSRSLAPPARR